MSEIAHSHPRGPLAFSSEDESTFEALEVALGRPLVYSVVSPRGMIRRVPGQPDELVSPEPRWANDLRVASGLLPGFGPRTLTRPLPTRGAG